MPIKNEQFRTIKKTKHDQNLLKTLTVNLNVKDTREGFIHLVRTQNFPKNWFFGKFCARTKWMIPKVIRLLFSC